MTVEETTASSPEELVVSVELANALIELLGIEEGSSRMSSVVLASGLVGAGLAGIKGLTGDAEVLLGPARTVDSRITIRVVSPQEEGVPVKCGSGPLSRAQSPCVPRLTACTSCRLITAKSPISSPWRTS